MNTPRRLKRWIALLMLAVSAFAHASVAFSGCALERSSLHGAIGVAPAAVHGCETAIATDWTKYPNRCLTHCTVDLQTVGAAVALVHGLATAPALVVDWPRERAAMGIGLDSTPPGTPPPRILLHSFLI